jgi:hypothetical protein
MTFSERLRCAACQSVYRWLCLCLLVSTASVHAQQTQDKATDPVVAGSIIARDTTAIAGDTFRSIARRELGKSGLSSQLAAFNDLPEDSPLEDGQLIRIPLYVPARREFATVVFVKGQVSRADTALQRDDEIYLNDLIATGENGFLSLEFSSGSVVNLQPNTAARLMRLNCLPVDDSCLIEVEADTGELKADVNSRNGQPTEFRITTPYASAAVRGTVFDVNTRDASVLIGVTEGNVDVAAQDIMVPLDAGFGAITEEGKPPSDPIELLPAPVYRYVPLRVAAGDEISWWELSDVNTWLAQLSTDSAGNSVTAEFSSTTNHLQITDVEPGDYYLNLRGLDGNGLKGFVSSTRLTVAAIDESLQPIDITVTRQGREFLASIVNPPADAAGFEIQVANTKDFTDPLSVDVGQPGSAVFRMDSVQVYARARLLLNPQTVSAFGAVAESR